MNTLEFDYHGLELFDARDKICDDVIEAYEIGEELQLIHGYKHGQAIRSYIWGVDGLRKDLKRVRPDIKLHFQKGKTKGITLIRFLGAIKE